jgi:signal transduction histidine kinase
MKRARNDGGRPKEMAANKAAKRILGLERELAVQAEVNRQSAEAWREAVHDLRGFLGVIKNSIAALNRESVPEPMRDEFLTMFRESTASMNAMLNDLSSLANLQAGHEHRKSTSFDAAALIKELCEELGHMARARGLVVIAKGPASLPAEGDAGKVRRIAENLVLIALHSIQRGAVTVTCGESAAGGSGQWTLDVRSNSTDTAPVPTAVEQSGVPLPHFTSEKIALALVRCLCELLGANLESEADAGKDNIFVVKFPRRYEDTGSQDSAK